MNNYLVIDLALKQKLRVQQTIGPQRVYKSYFKFQFYAYHHLVCLLEYRSAIVLEVSLKEQLKVYWEVLKQIENTVTGKHKKKTLVLVFRVHTFLISMEVKQKQNYDILKTQSDTYVMRVCNKIITKNPPRKFV